MSNVHTPERQPGETQAEYRERQRLSRRIVAISRLQGIGNQHSAPSQREQMRDQHRTAAAAGDRKPLKGIFGWALLQPQRRRNQTRMEEIHKQRDEHGATTTVGRNKPVMGTYPWGEKYLKGWEAGRRMWLAGVSAQRGY